MQPRPEVRARFEAPELPERADEALLDDVLGVPLVAGEPERQPKRRFCMELDERTKGLTVTLAGTRQGGCRFAALPLRN